MFVKIRIPVRNRAYRDGQGAGDFLDTLYSIHSHRRDCIIENGIDNYIDDGLRDDGLGDCVEESLDDDLNGDCDRTDEDGLGNYLWLR
jgi:hypothetical protein